MSHRDSDPSAVRTRRYSRCRRCAATLACSSTRSSGYVIIETIQRLHSMHNTHNNARNKMSSFEPKCRRVCALCRVERAPRRRSSMHSAAASATIDTTKKCCVFVWMCVCALKTCCQRNNERHNVNKAVLEKRFHVRSETRWCLPAVQTQALTRSRAHRWRLVLSIYVDFFCWQFVTENKWIKLSVDVHCHDCYVIFASSPNDTCASSTIYDADFILQLANQKQNKIRLSTRCTFARNRSRSNLAIGGPIELRRLPDFGEFFF